MGTRHLIEVKSGGELKVAQYGQWDGYPTGQGIGIANFLHGIMDVEKFRVALAECSFADEAYFASARALIASRASASPICRRRWSRCGASPLT